MFNSGPVKKYFFETHEFFVLGLIRFFLIFTALSHFF